MKTTIIMDKTAIAKLVKSQQQALEQTGAEILTRTINDAVIPFNIGTMQNEQTFVDNSQSKQGLIGIVTDTPYAMRMYMHPEYNFQTVNNANARGEWWYPFISGAKKEEPNKIFRQLLKLYGQRYIK